jgi:2-C-methyl-D-erythritol 4-phosphate cytidylyltransferase
MQETSAVIIVAAGASRRMGRDKLWIPLAGRIVLARTIDAFEASPSIDTIIIVTSTERLEDTRELCQRESWTKVQALIPGGARRQDSVCCGLDALAEIQPQCQWVMIHDGARPLVSQMIIEAGLHTAIQHQAAIAAMPVKDTIKKVQNGIIQDTPDRELLWAVQTPQVFSFPLIHQAHHSPEASGDATDDALLLERLGHSVAIFPGSYTNIKITTAEDLLVSEAILKVQEQEYTR